MQSIVYEILISMPKKVYQKSMQKWFKKIDNYLYYARNRKKYSSIA